MSPVKGWPQRSLAARFGRLSAPSQTPECRLVDIATHMNLLHYKEGEESRRRYVTAMFLRLDPKTHTLEVVNAGHNPAFLLNGNDVP